MIIRDSLTVKISIAILVFCLGSFVWCKYLIISGPLSYFEQFWPISLTMMFGSFVAGATSEGGGAIAFPVFTKILDIPPYDAKVFSLAIQSVGMSAASVLIILSRTRIEWRAVLWASFGGFVGMAIYASFLVNCLSPEFIRLLFTSLLASFALTLALLNYSSSERHHTFLTFNLLEKFLLFAFGCLGGVVAGLIGNGIDIIIFSLMVLLFRIDEKIATQTSVVLMAINAIAGFILHLFVLDSFTPEIHDYWLAAIPVVLVCAPLGAIACSLLRRNSIVFGLLFLILVEVISSLVLISFTFELFFYSSICFVVFLSAYFLMYQSKKYEVESDALYV